MPEGACASRTWRRCSTPTPFPEEWDAPEEPNDPGTCEKGNLIASGSGALSCLPPQSENNGNNCTGTNVPSYDVANSCACTCVPQNCAMQYQQQRGARSGELITDDHCADGYEATRGEKKDEFCVDEKGKTVPCDGPYHTKVTNYACTCEMKATEPTASTMDGI